jgi:hypothetical protein
MIERLMNNKLDKIWPNLGHYPGICQEELKKTTKHLSQDIR